MRALPAPTMSAIDLDDYVAWLRARGIADEHLPLYREGAEAVVRQMAAGETEVRHDHIEAAADIEAAMGASERRLANLRAIGARLQAYLDEQRVPPAAAYGPPPDEEPVLELADVPRGHSRRARLARTSQPHAAVDAEARVRGTMVDDLASPEPAKVSPEVVPATMPPRAALAPAAGPVSARMAVPSTAVPFTEGPRPGVLASPTRSRRYTLDHPPLPGCVCRVRQEVYADDLWSAWGKVYVFIASTVGVALAMFWTRTASLAIGMAVLAIGGLATAATAGWKCNDCRRWIERRGLDEDQRDNLMKRRGVFLAIGVAAAIVGLLAIRSLRADLARDRQAQKVLNDLKTMELDGTGD